MFQILNSRVKDDLRAGKNVVCDSTGINRKRRMAFLSELKNIPCEKVCVFFATPIEICYENNKNRDRVVPDEVIDRMYKSINIPSKNEGWDEVQLVYFNSELHPNYVVKNCNGSWVRFYQKYENYNQHNSHHTLSLGEHCNKTCEYVCEHFDRDLELQYAAAFHDCAKPMCKSFINSKNERTQEAHYYNHQYCSSYESLFYYLPNDVNKLEVALLIEFHMFPYLAWKQSDKAKERDKEFLGEELFDKVMKLHMADTASH